MSSETFDPNTIYCVVKARMDLGENPQHIFDELKSCKVIDISALRAVMKKLSPGKYPERRTTGLKLAKVYQFIKRVWNRREISRC